MNQIKSWKITGVLGSDKYFAITTPLGKIWVKNVLVLCTVQIWPLLNSLITSVTRLGGLKKFFYSSSPHIGQLSWLGTFKDKFAPHVNLTQRTLTVGEVWLYRWSPVSQHTDSTASQNTKKRFFMFWSNIGLWFYFWDCLLTYLREVLRKDFMNDIKVAKC